MKWLSEKITDYVVKNDAVSEESYAIYQYGFQIGLEMLCCFVVCMGIAVYLHMIPEFIVFTGIFMLLRTYAGGVHLNSFAGCFFCSVAVQTCTLWIAGIYEFSIYAAWSIILISTVLILKMAPVENMNRELDSEEKAHCKKVTMKILIAVLVFAASCTIVGLKDIVSLTAWTVSVILISQYIGAIKYLFEKNKEKRR